MIAAQLEELPQRLVLVAEEASRSVRDHRGERLEQLFEQRCHWIRQQGWADHLALDSDDIALTYDQLDNRANQLARYLRLHGVNTGDRIALLFDQTAHAYIGMLAVLKINAVYVPLDVSFSPARMAHIVSDAGVRMVLTLSNMIDNVGDVTELGAELVLLDRAASLIADLAPRPLLNAERGSPVDDLAYITYASGPTERPNGVAVHHSSICNFVRLAAEEYGVQPHDRLYQHLDLAFDFSGEAVWVSCASGATLVSAPHGARLLGRALHEFLTRERVTGLSCAPTLLASLDRDLPLLRFVLVSGEACPQELVQRWYRPDRRLLNVYGPAAARRIYRSGDVDRLSDGVPVHHGWSAGGSRRRYDVSSSATAARTEMFGSYRLEELLGQGGMGEVHRAYDTHRERTVALKRLRPGLASDAEYQTRFRLESRLAARLSSPHIIPIHDFGEINGRLFIDMRLATGSDLAKMIAMSGPLSPTRAVDIARQVADALDCAHEDGLIHNDVKPSNVLISSHRNRDFAYLIDFGIVRTAADVTPQTAGSPGGTLHYMAPELFTGAPLGKGVDVYALGCLLFEALAGHPPFVGESTAVMCQHIHDAPPRPSWSRPEIGPNFDSVIGRALAKDPDARFRTAGELAEAAHSALMTRRPGRFI
jgi:hypothetical protein